MSKSGKIAQEIVSSIKTVIAFGGEKKEIKRYSRQLRLALENGIKRNITTGIDNGIQNVVLELVMAFCIWFGVTILLDPKSEFNSGYLIIILKCFITFSNHWNQGTLYLEAISMAKGSAVGIFEIIDRKPSIDISSESGLKPSKFRGRIEFRNVSFEYPTRLKMNVLRNINFVIEEGKTVAIVGPSGSGKSTIVQLIQRFYDPSEGQILIDDENIKNYNLAWLRDHIGVVSQEPLLFNATIKENIMIGCPTANLEDIEKSCKEALADEFVNNLPLKYDSLVGEKGTQLSGGEKQRIALARALVKKPKLLLLDEATSSLDPKSEYVVQKAIEKLSPDRTTLIIAHRLSTVKHADKIIVLNNGCVNETGNHQQLMKIKGIQTNFIVRNLQLTKLI